MSQLLISDYLKQLDLIKKVSGSQREIILRGAPPESLAYKLGNRCAIDWVLDQHKEKKPKDATIRERFDTYRFADQKEKVVDLLQRVTTVSVETVRITEAMKGGDAMSVEAPLQRHYFVDEAGDPVLFDAKGRALPGLEGCSRHFILGVLDVADPVALGVELDALRVELLADPYFRDVPSMQPERRKTAWMFHAKDDVPEVRREVFRVLMHHPVQFFAVVRDKHTVLDYVRQRNRLDERYRYHPNELYDTMVARLFKNRLHMTPEVHVCFAERGKSDRSAALGQALETARKRFETQWQLSNSSVIRARQSSPRREVPLQATDYFLWALQRYFERGESRYIEMLWPQVGLVHAVDETEVAPYGVYYTKKKPLPKGSG